MDPKYPEDKSVPVLDNGVPGPGQYNPKDSLPVPNFKISKASPTTKQYKDWKDKTEVKQPVGPQTYNPTGNQYSKGIKIGNSDRYEERGSFIHSPAPNRY